jgi:hypothetical protein
MNKIKVLLNVMYLRKKRELNQYWIIIISIKRMQINKLLY